MPQFTSWATSVLYSVLDSCYVLLLAFGTYVVSHIDSATNVDIRSLAKEIEMVPTDSNTLAYCGSGHRAGMALPALVVLDHASSKACGGSYDSLVEAGAPVAAQ